MKKIYNFVILILLFSLFSCTVKQSEIQENDLTGELKNETIESIGTSNFEINNISELNTADVQKIISNNSIMINDSSFIIEDIENITESILVEDKNEISDLINKIPSEYWYWNEVQELGGVVSGNIRRLVATTYDGGRISGWGATDFYWNTQTGDIIKIGHYLSRDCLNNSNGTEEYVAIFYRTRSSESELPISPKDWLIKFIDVKPLEIRSVNEVIKTPISAAYVTIDKTIKFGMPDGIGYYILKINSKLGVPFVVEEHFDDKQIRYYKYEYDTVSHTSFKRTPLKKLVNEELDKGIILLESDYEDFISKNDC